MSLLEDQIGYHTRMIEAYKRLEPEADIADRLTELYKESSYRFINDMNYNNVRINVMGADAVEEAVQFLRWFSQNGYHMKEKPEVGTSSVLITWKLVHRTREGGRIDFVFWIDGENAQCKLVEVGKREVPIYEIKCNGGNVDLPTVEDVPLLGGS